MKAMILLAPSEVMRNFFFADSTEAKIEMAKAALKAGQYNATAPIACESVGEQAAEEMFELTNNPFRQEEREEKYGRLRSVSTGDIVVTGDDMWLCMSFGWEKM